MPRSEFVKLVQEIKSNGKGKEMTTREFLWLFDFYEKRTSGNVWRINEYLRKTKMVVNPSYQSASIDEIIEIKEKVKAKIVTNKAEITEAAEVDEVDPINRLSILTAATKTPVFVKRDAKLLEAFHLLWQNDFTQLPVMNDERTVLGIISWQTIAKGYISKIDSDCVKDFMSDNFIVLDEKTPLFNAIKEVIKIGVVFVKDNEKKIKGPVTPSDLNEQFIELIEPFILLEQIENYIRLIFNSKITIEQINKLIKVDEEKKLINFVSDMSFGEYIIVLQNSEIWSLLDLPFDKTSFIKNLDDVRNVRNGVMHFSPDRISKKELELLRKTSKFLDDFLSKKR